jgi:NTP pyrophosphatase (non-canonical NTP hydrolase)
MGNYKFKDDYPVEGMTFSSFTDYQDFTATTDKAGTNLNTVLGMAGEVGEILGKAKSLTFTQQVPDVDITIGNMVVAALNCEQMKKRTRVEKLEAISFDRLTKAEKEALANEAADVVWYLARFCDRLGQDFGQVMQRNVAKLSSRKTRGVLHGKGDTR